MSGSNGNGHGDYAAFLNRKTQLANAHGFDPVWMPEFLKGFQEYLVRWSVMSGRGGIFADCGLGKTPMQLVWAENIVRKTNKRILIVTPLAVSYQTIHEGEKFGIQTVRSHDGRFASSDKIIVTNYQQLHKFNPADFGGCCCDESSAIKHADSATKELVVEFMRTLQYRLLCTATAAPNDFFELGTSSEALGEMGFQDMLTRFFKEETTKDHLGWGRKTYRFRGHAEQPFWKWVCSWARSCRMPSDLGFSDGEFTLPPLVERELVVHSQKKRPGYLLAIPAKTLADQRAERNVSLQERCEAASELAIKHDGSTVLWCHLNPEGDLIERITPDAVQVAGHMSDEMKEERLLAFQRGEIKRLVIKPKIGAWGLNWQHCHNVVTFASHSWEQRYQSIRRCWRFGQKHPVTVTTITTDGEQAIIGNLKRKAAQCERMFSALVGYMNEATRMERQQYGTQQETVPSWLSSHKT